MSTAFKITPQSPKKVVYQYSFGLFLITHHKGRMLFCRVVSSFDNGGQVVLPGVKGECFTKKVKKKRQKDYLAKKSVQVFARTWSGEKTADRKKQIEGSISY